MIKPTVHMNGTSGGMLLEGFLDCCRKVREAVEMLERNGPNARDYYLQGDDAYGQASREHAARINRLLAVAVDLEELAGDVQEQQDKRQLGKLEHDGLMDAIDDATGQSRR
jgi:hypothetical protein